MDNYYIATFQCPGVLSTGENVQNLAIKKFQSLGIEEFNMDEQEVDKLLGTRSYSGGDVPESVIDEVNTFWLTEKSAYKAYFDCEKQANLFCDFLSSHNIQSLISVKENQDWNAVWRESYHPILIPGGLEIIPQWLKGKIKEEGDRKYVYIYPGQGFGTGNHSTTFLCCEIYLEVIKSFRKNLPLSENLYCCDFGCGSGILGISHLIYNPESYATFLDIDPAALENTFQNLELNQIEAKSEKIIVDLYDHDFKKNHKDHERKYHIVFANILENILIAEGEAISSLLAPGGQLILSGLLVGQEPAVIKFYEQLGCEFQMKKIQGDWVAVLLQKPMSD